MLSREYVVAVLERNREAQSKEIERLKGYIEKRERIRTARKTGVYDVESGDFDELTNEELLSLSQSVAQKRRAIEESLRSAKLNSAALNTELSDLRIEHTSLITSITSVESKIESLRQEANSQAGELLRVSERIQAHRGVQQTARNHIETQDIVRSGSWSPKYRSSSNTSIMTGSSSAKRTPKATYYPTILRCYKASSRV